MIRIFSFEKWHNRRGVGSTKIRVHNLIRYWPEAGLYRYGEDPDVMIYQKVYMTENWKFPTMFKGIQILDICDPDWLEGAAIKETVDHMDAVVCPTEPLAEFIRQLTDKPVRVIKDRFDLSEFPAPKVHSGPLKRAVWFGYNQNAELLKFAIPSLEKRNIALTVISDQDPQAFKWAESESYEGSYEFIKHKDHQDVYKRLQQSDVCILPKGNRAKDRFKSENKTVIARLLGLPVVDNSEQLDKLKTAPQRNKVKDKWYDITYKEYDVENSVREYKQLIDEIKIVRKKHGRSG